MNDAILQYSSKRALLDALEQRRAWAKRYDRAEAAKHKAAERDYLVTFRKELRDALTWSYEEARKHRFDPRQDSRWAEPRCPKSAVAAIDACIRVVNTDGRQRYKITPRTWASAHWVLTFNEDEKASVCE